MRKCFVESHADSNMKQQMCISEGVSGHDPITTNHSAFDVSVRQSSSSYNQIVLAGHMMELEASIQLLHFAVLSLPEEEL